MSIHPLDQATECSVLSPERFAVQLSPLFWGHTAAHGGYLAALLLSTMIKRLDDPTRHPRSLHVTFLKGPASGEAEVHTEMLRAGGRMTMMAARLVQPAGLATCATAVFGPELEGPTHLDPKAPEVQPPETYPEMPRSRIAIDQRFEHRQAFGQAPFSGASEARIGGYSRLEAPRILDAVAVTLLCDAWWPALFPTLEEKRGAGACPTLDLTVHFRSAFPLPDSLPEDYVLLDLRTEAMQHGYLDEHCRVWSKDGRLLAQSVQHALRLLPKKPG